MYVKTATLSGENVVVELEEEEEEEEEMATITDAKCHPHPCADLSNGFISFLSSPQTQ